MYFIRMMLLWLVLIVLIAMCSGSDEIPLYCRAEQSSTYSSILSILFNYPANNAIDNVLTTYSSTIEEDPAWLRVYCTSPAALQLRVVIEQGYNYDATCVYTVSVYDGETETVCGTYTKPFG